MLKVVLGSINVCSRFHKYSTVHKYYTILYCVEESEPCVSQFLYEYNAKNIVKESTCFKIVLNPSCIDL